MDYDKLRSDIGEGKPGVPLTVRLAVMDAKRCMPLSNATLDIWHCDAQGVYSGFTANGGGFGPRGGRGPRGGFPPGPPEGAGPDGPPSGDGPPPGYGPPLRGGSAREHHALDETRFLRGSQTTNAAGMIEFQTIYPGWYEGRTIHIHMKVHTGGHASGHVCHTGQLFFPEDVTLKIAKQQPYAKHTDTHLTTLSEDHVYEDEHGAAGMVTLARAGAGYMAMATLAVDPEATPKAVGMGGPGGPGFGPGSGPRR